MAGNWTELLQKLKNGEIDLLSDVSFMEDRAQDMLYASLPMGTEAYYIFGPAGCVIISNYRYNNIAMQCEKLHLTTV